MDNYYLIWFITNVQIILVDILIVLKRLLVQTDGQDKRASYNEITGKRDGDE
jgi:hypothetical protein